MRAHQPTRVSREELFPIAEKVVALGPCSLAMLNAPTFLRSSESSKPDPSKEGERRILESRLPLYYARVSWAWFDLVILETDVTRIARLLLSGESQFRWAMSIASGDLETQRLTELARSLEIAVSKGIAAQPQANLFVLDVVGNIKEARSVT